MTSYSENLPGLLVSLDKCLNKGRFVLSSGPAADRKVAEQVAHQVRAIRSILVGLTDFTILTASEIVALVEMLDEVLTPLEEYLASPIPSPQQPRAPKIYVKSKGRPRFRLDVATAIQLHDMGNTWTDIAKAMGVSRRTMYRHLAAAGISSARIAHSEIEDDDLDSYVSSICLLHPYSGARIVSGHLKTLGIRVPLRRVHESLKRVDEVGVSLRFQQAIKRRVYRVRGANALWHQDGNEKLKPWGFYVHGCVDGYSRMVVYLVCTSNKRSRTVGNCFREAVSRLGWPSRVRGDFGTENNEIEREMVRHWGVTHRAYLRGRSIHNIRIERLWRDVRRDSLEVFRQLFFQMEEAGILDPENDIHLICLYLVYQPRIQKSLDETRTSWNNHSIRTARNKTPLAMYNLSKEHAINSGIWQEDMGDPLRDVDESYGEDPAINFQPPARECREEPTAPRSDHFAGIEEETEAGILVVDDDDIAAARELLEDMDFSQDDGSWGVDLFCEAVTRLSHQEVSSDSDHSDSSTETDQENMSE